MSFLKNVFKKKPGGSMVGNLFRKGINMASGGVLGTGEQIAKRDANDAINQQYNAILATQGKAVADTYKSLAMTGASPDSILGMLQPKAAESEPKKPFLDLNDFLKLPTINHGMDTKQMPIVPILIGVAALIFLPKLLSKK